MRKMTAAEKKEYDKLTKQAEQLKMQLEALENKPVTYGYARVSTKGQAKDGNSLEAQEKALVAAGAEEIYKDAYTGSTTERPALKELLSVMKSGDTLVVAKLDRIARSVQDGIKLIDSLLDRNIAVNVLNMGRLDNTPTGRLIRNVMLAFAEFERSMIMERTREGKEIARTRQGFREGRKPKFTEYQLVHAVELLKDHTYAEVAEQMKMSKSTIIRAVKQYGGMLTEKTV